MSATEVAPDPIEVLESSVAPVFVVLGEGEDRLVFEQKELTFFGKIDFFAVMANAITKAINEGISISELLDMPEKEDGESGFNIDDFVEADKFVKAISQLIAYTPDLLLDLYCVFLAVPRDEREYVKERLQNDMTDEQGFKVIETFVDQNWEVLVGFFSERISPLVRKVGAKVQASVPSKPSKRTRRTTRKESAS